jgi:hypothetical protein
VAEDKIPEGICKVVSTEGILDQAVSAKLGLLILAKKGERALERESGIQRQALES